MFEEEEEEGNCSKAYTWGGSEGGEGFSEGRGEVGAWDWPAVSTERGTVI